MGEPKCVWLWKRQKPHAFPGGKECGFGQAQERLRLEVKLQSELKDTRIAHGAGINAEGAGAECGVGDDEVGMIENVERLGTERQAVFLREQEPLAEIHVPVLFKGSVDNVPAEIAEERAAGRTNRKGLIAWATENVEAGNDRAASQHWRGSQGARIKDAGGASEILWTAAQHKAIHASDEVWKSVRRRYSEQIGGADSAGDGGRQTGLKGSQAANRPVAESIAESSSLKPRLAIFIGCNDAVRNVEVRHRALSGEIQLVAGGGAQILIAASATAGFIVHGLGKSIGSLEEEVSGTVIDGKDESVVGGVAEVGDLVKTAASVESKNAGASFDIVDRVRG